MGVRKEMSIILSLLLFCFIQPGAATAKKITIWGSTTCQKRFLEPGADALIEISGIEITVEGVGTGGGLLALIDGKTDLSAASEDLYSAIISARKTAAKEGRSISVPDNLFYHKVSEDIIIPIVNQNNPVSHLTRKQLKDIHTGTVTNWKEVGGPDLPIQVITSHIGSATRSVFQKKVMGSEEYVASAVKVDSTRKQILEVGKHRGGIGAVSIGFLLMYTGNTKAIVMKEKITRSLGLITIGPPKPEIKRIINFFLSDQGRNIAQNHLM